MADYGEVRVASRAAGDRPMGRRALALGILAAAVAASGAGLDRIGPRSAAATPPLASPQTGAWFCPHGGGPGWIGWLAVANPGSKAATVRVTSFGQGGAKTSQTFTLGPASQVYRAIDASEAGASTEVEYFGAWVAAATVVQARRPPLAVAAERCVDAPHSSWILPDESTSKGETARIVVMNPFDVVAEFSVVLSTEQRTIRPGSLTPDVLKPGQSEAITVNRFVLEGPGERTVTAQVIAQVGRVVAGGVVTSSGGIRAEAALPQPSSRWIIPAAGYGQVAGIPAVNTGSRSLPLSVVQQGQSGTALAAGLGRETLQPGRARTVQALGPLVGGVVVSSSPGSELGAALRVSGPTSGQATITGAPSAAGGWVVLPAVPASGGPASLILQNPGTRTVQAQVKVIGSFGEMPSSFGTVSVPPGRELVLPLGVAFGDSPVTAVVTASGEGIVAGEFSTPFGGRGYAATVGIRMPSSGL